MNLEKLAQSNILQTLRLDKLEEEVQKEAMGDAAEIILQSVVDEIEGTLPAEVRDEFGRVFDEENEEERKAFIKKYVPNFQNLLVVETLRYKYLTELIVSQEEEEGEGK